MILATHVILSAYGFWLPNDPRGSWSDFCASWELFRYGPATKVTTTRSVAHLAHDRAKRLAAKTVLKYPPVRFGRPEVACIADGFAIACKQGGYVVSAAAILHDHAHLVVHRHARDIAQIVSHLKSQATRTLRAAGLHPFEDMTYLDGSVPGVWSESYWKVYIDDPKHLRAANRYVAANPLKEGLGPQRWAFQTNSSE